MVKLKRIGYVDKVFHGSTGSHVASCFIGEPYRCSCISWDVRKKCKHVNKLLSGIMAKDLEDILNSKDDSKRLESNLNILNELVSDDLYNSDEIIAFYGKPQSGKSLLALQEIAYLSAQGKNILYIDTEGSITPMMRAWMPIFEKRFGKRKGKILVEVKKKLQSEYDSKGKSTKVGLMEYIGYHVNINYKSKHKTKKKKGKLEFNVVENIKNPEIEKVIKENDIDFVVIDSITAPMKVFTKNQQNYPSRDDAQSFLLRKLLDYQEEYKVAMLVIAHCTFNPTNPYETKAGITGGQSVKYFGKRLIYIDKREMKDLSTYRRLWIVRSENTDAWAKAGVAQIDDEGYHTIEDKKLIKQVFTSTELNRLELDLE